jgi:hypothetical protein
MPPITLHGTVLQIPSGFAVTWKMNNLRRGFRGMVNDLEILGQRLRPLNGLIGGPEFSVKIKKTVGIPSCEQGRLHSYTYTNVLQLNKDNTISIANSQKNLDDQGMDINLIVSRSGITINGVKYQNMLLAITMAVRNESTINYNTVSFHLLLQNSVGRNLFDDHGDCLWPISIEEVKEGQPSYKEQSLYLKNKNYSMLMPEHISFLDICP